MKRLTIKCSVVNVSGWRRKQWGGRCQGGDGSNGVEDVRVSDGWKMSGWIRKRWVEDVRVETEAMGWKMSG